MSSRRSSSAGSSNMTNEEINNLVLKLQALLPQLKQNQDDDHYSMVSASKILKEICNYIKNLRREVDGLSETLSKQLDSFDSNAADSDILTSLLTRH